MKFQLIATAKWFCNGVLSLIAADCHAKPLRSDALHVFCTLSATTLKTGYFTKPLRGGFTIAICLLSNLLIAQSEKISPSIRLALQNGQTPDILVMMHDQPDVSGAAAITGKYAKGVYVFNLLKASAARSQQPLRQLLDQFQANANSYYLVNAVAVQHCQAELIQKIASLPEVKSITSDPWIKFPEPAKDPMDIAGSRNGVEWGIQKINATQVWDLGFQGQGITVGGADTGYDWAHPAIKAKYRGYTSETVFDHNYNWHDGVKVPSPLNPDSIPNPCGIDIDAPCDDNSHGTHTAGTMVGDDGQGNQIGVAPQAQWVGCRNMDRGWGRPSSYLECFEWFLAPTDVNDQNPNPLKAPHVVNNSWYCSVEEGCTDLTVNELMRTAVINLKAAGVVVVVSNGNFGSQGCGSTYGPPAYFEESFSIGSTKENDTISNFSSRGPVLIDGSNRIKPNVSAPGQFVRSCIPNGNYAHFSGTSMAGPHVAGLVALLLSANPELAGQVDVIEDIIESTCLPINGLSDCSDNGGLDYPNNTYGYGRVDALRAVQEALALSNTNEPRAFSPVVFPNPASHTLYFAVQHDAGNGLLKIVDARGNRVHTSLEQMTPGRPVQVSTSKYPRGIYFWQIQTNDGKTASGKIAIIGE